MKLKLINKILEAKDTISFFFEPEYPVTFLAGQYFYFTLPRLNYLDARGPVRQFTISSSPTEGKNLRITTRIRQESGFKKTLDELAIGETIQGEGPHGIFTLINNQSLTINHIFLAGGIGITPFRSIIKNLVDTGAKLPTHLVYSNSDHEFVFKQELDAWKGNHNWLKINYIDTSESGRLDEMKINKLIENWKLKINNCLFWLSGPSTFVNAIDDILQSMSISEDNIKTDKFTGY